MDVNERDQEADQLQSNLLTLYIHLHFFLNLSLPLILILGNV